MSHAATPSKMTLPTQRSPFPNSADLDVNSIMNNREFQEMLQEYFQNNSMTLDEFLEHLPRFMMGMIMIIMRMTMMTMIMMITTMMTMMRIISFLSYVNLLAIEPSP